MFGLIGFILTVSAGAAWRANDKASRAKYRREWHETYDGTDLEKQYHYFSMFAGGLDPQGNKIKEAHKYQPEINRLTKLQLEKEGIRYYDKNSWNISKCTFNENNELLTVGGKKFDRRLGRTLY